MQLDDLKQALKTTAHREMQQLLAQDGTQHSAAMQTVLSIQAVVDQADDEPALLANLKILCDQFTREDLKSDTAPDAASINETILSETLGKVIDHYGTPDTTPSENGVADLEKHRRRQMALSPTQIMNLSMVFGYCQSATAARQTVNTALLDALGAPPGIATAYQAMYEQLRKELHPETNDMQLHLMTESRMEHAMAMVLQEGFYKPQAITEPPVDAATLPVHGLALICAVHDMADARTRATRMIEGSDLYAQRFKRELREVLQDLKAEDRYQCKTTGQFLETMEWIIHGIDQAHRASQITR